MGLGSLHSLAVSPPSPVDRWDALCGRLGLYQSRGSWAPVESYGAAQCSPGRASGLVTGAQHFDPSLCALRL